MTHEPVAIQEYTVQQSATYHNLSVSPCGFIVCKEYPFLGATPDGCVCCSSSTEPDGFLEVKCPYTQHDMTPFDAYRTPGFCCELQQTGSILSIRLRRSHRYYAQVQGQMAAGNQKWCDFVIYTRQGIAINYDPD